MAGSGRWMIAAGFAFGSGLLFAQGEAVKLVRLTAVVTDGRGQPVTDLTADDFRIADDGKPQRILFFRGPGKAQAVSGGEISNRPVPVPQHTAILFDFLNQNRTDRLDATRKIGASLKQLESGESVFFYLLSPDGKIYPIHETTQADKTWTRDIENLLAKANKTENKNRPAGMNDEEVVKKTYVALESMAKQLAAFPGHRDVVWVTNGVPNVSNPKTPCSGDWIDCALYVPHLSVTLDQMATVVHPMSYSSLIGPSVNQSMEEMASLTGARTWFSTEMDVVLKQLDQQAQGGYTIAYDPSRENWNNKFHKLKVTCERRGVKVQARQRYYALPDTRPGPAKEQAALVAAYQSAADVAEIGVRAALAPGASPNMVHVEVHIDPADLLLHENAGQFEGQLTVLLSARAATGPQGEPALSNLAVHLTREQREQVAKDGIPIARDYPIDAATQKVRLIVLDRNTNSVGSVTLPVAR